MFHAGRLSAAEPEVDGFLRLAGLSPGAAVLDLCCGVGRHSLELARRGFDVTGVDRTQSFLDQAAARVQAEGLNVEWVCEDMRLFRRPEAFDAAIWFYTSIGFFQDDAEDMRVMEHVFASLKPGGILGIETRGREDVRRDFQERDWHGRGEEFILEERSPAQDWSRMDVRWIRIHGAERGEARFSLRLYSSLELKRMLTHVGFREVEARGDLDGRPYDAEATRLVLLARKPG